ncbi:hypothetical protein MKW92_043342 [Papaver armeniacum]|nr:hypothetical protein MKW92_043342 [Papaver armeniacum]
MTRTIRYFEVVRLAMLKILPEFLWAGNPGIQNRRELHLLVKRSQVCKKKNMGGLGIKSSRKMNDEWSPGDFFVSSAVQKVRTKLPTSSWFNKIRKSWWGECHFDVTRSGVSFFFGRPSPPWQRCSS